MSVPATIRLFGTAPDSIVDGPGLRFSVFVQGCTHGCPGCHNPESQPACGGEVRPIDDIVAEIAANKLTQGVTISGGEPFEQVAACAEIARQVRALGLNVWTYSGYRYEDLTAQAELAAATTTVVDGGVDRAACAAADFVGAALKVHNLDPVGVRALLDATDVLVDGPFVQSLHSFDLSWRGSSNQRLIDVSATRRLGRIVLWETHQSIPQKPPSW